MYLVPVCWQRHGECGSGSVVNRRRARSTSVLELHAEPRPPPRFRRSALLLWEGDNKRALYHIHMEQHQNLLSHTLSPNTHTHTHRDTELAPRLSLVSPKVFFSILSSMEFGSLPRSPLACLVGDTSFPAILSTWLNRNYLNWTELDNAITEFNNEMSLTENWVFNLVILHYWHTIFPILILCSCFDNLYC